ncbi:MAG TPA: peroxiredoxin [Candidatus Limnocylindrales bacterium]|jgi:peroxiredoxin (alkyl hydroperoxide reductase subunit C)|nr:peroxiredoxin [Candidatus Limnocylindrales bacterium]
MSLQLGAPVPDFEAISTHGPIKLSNYKGQWVLLFSHPADFTPVCTTEFIEFAKRYDEFKKRGVVLIGNSVDSIYSHIAWTRNIEEKMGVKIPFPVIADLDQKVAKLYGMVHEPTSVTATVRCVFFIDPNQILRAMIYYPLTTGRNMDEILRVIDSLQAVDKYGVATPANWQPGDPVIVPAPQTTELAEKRLQDQSVEAKDWYFSLKRI